MILSLRAAAAGLAAAAALLAPGAGAAADPYAYVYDCKPDGKQQQMNDCAALDYQAADAALNARYREVMDSLSPPLRDALRSEQRRWLRGRDPACKRAAKAYDGGSIWPLIFNRCLEKATRKRTAELESWHRRQP